MEIVLTEWLSAILRWLHVIAAIAWIGSSFYFIHLDLGLKNHGALPAGVKGELWQVHGGGFYQMIKFMVAPSSMPDELVWFKWEAYTTWLSGFALLVVVYYFNAELFLVDKAVLDLSAPMAATVAFLSLAAAWIAYEVMCRSPLGKHEVALALVGYVFLVVLTFGFTHVFSGRGAFTQIGALIGTIMVANVFVVIMPYQAKSVKALIAGQVPDPEWNAIGKQRSVHNNYLTLPVIFLMLSNHYPLFFATQYNWADRRHCARDRAGHPALLQCAARGQGRPVVDLAGGGNWHAGDRMAVGHRGRHQDGRVAGNAEIRGGAGHRDVPLQHVPCGRAGMGRLRHGAQRRAAGFTRADQAACQDDRHQRGAFARHAARQYHGYFPRRPAGAGGLDRRRRAGAIDAGRVYRYRPVVREP